MTRRKLLQASAAVVKALVPAIVPATPQRRYCTRTLSFERLSQHPDAWLAVVCSLAAQAAVSGWAGIAEVRISPDRFSNFITLSVSELLPHDASDSASSWPVPQLVRYAQRRCYDSRSPLPDYLTDHAQWYIA